MDEVEYKTFIGRFKVRKLAPMPINHPGVGKACFFCGKPVLPDQVFCQIPTRPATETDQIKMLSGIKYMCLYEVAHWSCTEKFEEKRK